MKEIGGVLKRGGLAMPLGNSDHPSTAALCKCPVPVVRKRWGWGRSFRNRGGHLAPAISLQENTFGGIRSQRSLWRDVEISQRSFDAGQFKPRIRLAVSFFVMDACLFRRRIGDQVAKDFTFLPNRRG